MYKLLMSKRILLSIVLKLLVVGIRQNLKVKIERVRDDKRKNAPLQGRKQ